MDFVRKHSMFFKVLVVALILYFSLVGYWTGFTAKMRIISHVKQKTGLTLEIGRVYLYPFTGNGYLKNLRVPNPSGSVSKYALKIAEINFKGSGKAIYADVLNIQSMHVKGIELVFEQSEAGNNFQKMHGAAVKYYDAEGSNVDKGLKSFTIDQLSIDPVSIYIGHKLLNKTVTLDALELQHVGIEEQGIGMVRLGKLLLREYNPSIQRILDDSGMPLNAQSKNIILNWLDQKR